MHIVTQISKAVWIGLMLILLSSCTAQTLGSSDSVEPSQNATGTAIVGSNSTIPDISKEITYPNLSDFKLEEMLEMSGKEILDLLDRNGFVSQGSGLWKNESTDIVFRISFEGIGDRDPRKSLKANLPIVELGLYWILPDITADMQTWIEIWPDITNYFVKECGLTNELGRGYSHVRIYETWGTSDSRGQSWYWNINCFIPNMKKESIATATIHQYKEGDLEISNEEELMQYVQALYTTASDAIVKELPYERDARFAVNDGGKPEGKQVLNIVIKDRELSESGVKSLVDEWLKGLFLIPDDYNYTYEQSF